MRTHPVDHAGIHRRVVATTGASASSPQRMTRSQLSVSWRFASHGRALRCGSHLELNPGPCERGRGWSESTGDYWPSGLTGVIGFDW